MDITQAITEIRSGMGFRTTLQSTIIRALNSVQRGLEEGLSLPEFLLEFDAEIVVTGGDETIALPDDFLRLHDSYEMYYVDSDEGRVSIPLRTEAEARNAYGDVEDSTRARVWVRRSKTAGILVPTPTESFTYYLTYYKAEPVLTLEQATNKWLTYLPDVLVGAAGLEVASAARDKDAIAFFQQRLQRGERVRMGGIVDSELQGRPLIMGRNN